MPKPLVSIITPTFGRARFLEAIAACVKSQTYGNVEWLVLDDSEQPSAALSALPADAVHYMHVAERLSIGEKRNRLVDMAQGEFIAHFDDDDYYAPDYLASMIAGLTAAKVDFVRLTGFFAAHLNQGQIGYYRTLVKQGPGFEFSARGVKPVVLDATNIPHIHLAFGWAYVYRKSVWQANPFKAINTFEDREFVRAAATQFQLKALEDRGVSCMHSVHRGSSSRCFPQFRVPAFMIRALAPEAIRHFKRLRQIAKEQS